MLTRPVNALVSYHYYGNRDIEQMAGWGLRLIGDSGAYSAQSLGVAVDIAAFAQWAQRWEPYLAWTASLDEIGDAEGSMRNYVTLRDRYGLDVVPTVHYGASVAELDKYAHMGARFVGLGGMVIPGQMKGKLAWCAMMFRHARDNYPEMRFHGWGATSRTLMTSLPWFSVDSSSAGAAYRYGRLSLFDPERGRDLSIALDGRELHRHGRLLRNVYGIDPDTVDVSVPSNKDLVVQVAVASVQEKERFLRRRFDIAPPPGQSVNGPHIHFVTTDYSAYRSLDQAREH